MDYSHCRLQVIGDRESVFRRRNLVEGTTGNGSVHSGTRKKSQEFQEKKPSITPWARPQS